MISARARVSCLTVTACLNVMRVAPIVALFVFSTSHAQSPSPVSVTPNAALAALGERYVEQGFALNPLRATFLGDARFNDRFVDELTPTARANDRQLQTETVANLKTIDAASLSATDQLTHAVILHRAQTRLEELRFDFHLTPINQFGSMPITLVQLASTEGAQPFRTIADYEAFLQRVNGLPGWVDSAIANMREGIAKNIVTPKLLIAHVLKQLKTQMATDGAQSGFYRPITKLPASFSEADRIRLALAYRTMIETKITPAFSKLHQFLETEYLPRARDTAGLAGTPNAAAKYAFKARESTTTTLTPDEIHQIGLGEVERIRTEMDKVRIRVGFKGDLQAFLASIPVNPALTPFKTETEVIDAYKVIQRRVEPLLDKLFSRQPRAALDIWPEPEITKATAAAHYNVGAPDGSRPGIFYAPVRDPLTYASVKMTALFLHEGLPGHHFEVSLAQESGLSRVRRYSRFTAYGEGWGLYAESLGNEMGVYDDPYQYMGRLLSEMHRAIRLVVDTGMHAKGWTREQAIEYSLENEGGRRADQVQEIERYMAIPGQALAYKIGELKIWELRRLGEKKLGPKFDLRAFHNELLRDGNLPLGVLEQKITRWIDAQAGTMK